MDWLSDAGTWLIGQWSWTTAGIAALATWFLGRVNALATKRTDAWLERKWDRWLAAREGARKKKAQAKTEAAKAARLRALATERVGRKFLLREEKDDTGVLIEVIGLDPGHPELRVRTRPVDQVDDPIVTIVEWRQLTKPAADQRHVNARVVEKSFDDDDGWVRYEEVPASGA